MLRSEAQEDFFVKVLEELRSESSDSKRTAILATQLNEYDARGFIKYILDNYRLLQKEVTQHYQKRQPCRMSPPQRGS